MTRSCGGCSVRWHPRSRRGSHGRERKGSRAVQGGWRGHQECFLTAAQRLGVAPADCVVLEDAPEGIQGGKASGMRCIGVATTRPPERLSEAALVVGRLADAG